MPMAGQPIIVSISDAKACPKARSTHRTLFQRTLDRCTKETRSSSCPACLTRLILHTTTVANQTITNIWRGLGHGSRQAPYAPEPWESPMEPATRRQQAAIVGHIRIAFSPAEKNQQQQQQQQICALHAAVVTHQAILAVMRDLSPNPNAARPIGQLQ